MPRLLTAVLSAVWIAAAFGVSGCTGDQRPAAPDTASPPTSASPTSTAAAQAAPLPPPDALAVVLYRLGDPAVPGIQKLTLVEGATPESSAAFDQFAAALLNDGFAPMKVDVRDRAWSDRDPTDVVANVSISSPNPRASTFTFPMEFTPYQGGWQLSARTADMLLAFNTAPPAPPVTTPGR